MKNPVQPRETLVARSPLQLSQFVGIQLRSQNKIVDDMNKGSDRLEGIMSGSSENDVEVTISITIPQRKRHGNMNGGGGICMWQGWMPHRTSLLPIDERFSGARGVTVNSRYQASAIHPTRPGHITAALSPYGRKTVVYME